MEYNYKRYYYNKNYYKDSDYYNKEYKISQNLEDHLPDWIRILRQYLQKNKTQKYT